MSTTESTESPTCPKCSGPMWDNRATKRNPKAPDHKCRDRDCDGAIWPPKDENAPPAEAGAPKGTPDDPACPSCGGKMWDNRKNKRNPKAPDFKCRKGPKYPATDGCPGVIWPPKDGEQAATGSKAAPARQSAPAAPPVPADDFPDFPGAPHWDEDEDPDLPF